MIPVGNLKVEPLKEKADIPAANARYDDPQIAAIIARFFKIRAED